jgi:hypothetical protein
MVLTARRRRPSVMVSLMINTLESRTDIDAISAMDSITKNIPKHTDRNIQMPPAVPPLVSDMPIILIAYRLMHCHLCK